MDAYIEANSSKNGKKDPSSKLTKTGNLPAWASLPEALTHG